MITAHKTVWPAVFTSFFIVIVIVIKLIMERRRKRSKMPPGPPGIPILGNAMQIPARKPWVQFSEWRDAYGPIFSLNLAGQPVIVLNDHKTVADLLDRRSSIYSDRPRFIVAGEYLTGGIFMVFMRYGEIWRKMRRVCHEEFNPRGCEKYQAAQFKEAVLNILDIVNDPKGWINYLKLSTASNILTATYGWQRVSRRDMSIVQRIHAHTAHIATAVIPGAFLVEILPILDFFPACISKWKKQAIQWHHSETEVFMEFLDDVKLNDSQCFVRSLLQFSNSHGLSKKESAWLAGIMFSAGAETTFGTIMNFVLAMTLYPEVMRNAQDQLDKVIGRDRLPSFDDKASLPYIRALVKETLRWRPVGPLAVPRRVIQDDVYRGYLIPKGSIIIPNVWGMNRDPHIFPDFDEFRPERFLDKTGQEDLVPPDTHGRGHVTFGFGRRICAGLNFAEQVLFIQMATLLWAFNFDKALDNNGMPITASKADVIDTGVVVLPASFECRITPRSADISIIAKRSL